MTGGAASSTSSTSTCTVQTHDRHGPVQIEYVWGQGAAVHDSVTESFCKYLAGQVWFFTLWNHYFFLRVCNRKKLCYGLKQKLHSEFSLIPVVPTQVIQMMNIIIVP